MSETVLVTGGAGFLGGYLVRNLAEAGYRVVILDVRPPGPEMSWILEPVKDRVEMVQGTVENWPGLLELFRRHSFGRVVHLATIVNPVLLNSRPDLAVHVNFMGTYHLLELSRQFGVARFVYFSSIGVLPSLKYEPIDADHPVIRAGEGPGSTFYGASKVASEAFCMAYYQSFGLDLAIIRPSAVYGFGMQWPLYVKPMVENSVAGLPTRFDHGAEFPRDYTHVQDVTQLGALALAAQPEQLKERIFYAATGRPLVTAGQVAEMISELIPGADIQIGSGLSAGDLIEIKYRGVHSIANAREMLGYNPRFADVRDGVAEYIETYRTYRAGAGSQ